MGRFGDGKLDYVFKTIMEFPQLDMHTVAGGRSSILSRENWFFKVGPDSAAVDPEATCLFRKGGPLTSNDADLFLKHIIPEFFPKVFGLNADEPLHVEIVGEKFHEVRKRIDREVDGNLSPEEVAYGFMEVASEMMARSIRAVSEARGYTILKHNVVTFGGVGGQLVVAVVAFLGIKTVLIR